MMMIMCVCVCMRETVCAREVCWERQSVYVCECARKRRKCVRVCVKEVCWERETVCIKENVRETACVCERGESMCVCGRVCVCDVCIYVRRDRQTEGMCVCMSGGGGVS